METRFEPVEGDRVAVRLAGGQRVAVPEPVGSVRRPEERGREVHMPPAFDGVRPRPGGDLARRARAVLAGDSERAPLSSVALISAALGFVIPRRSIRNCRVSTAAPAVSGVAMLVPPSKM